MQKKWMISLDGTLGKLAIDLAEKRMSFGFCKALLSEYAHISVMSNPTILQMACRYQCSLDTVKKLVVDNRELLLMEDGHGHVALHTAVKYASLDVVKYLVQENESACYSNRTASPRFLCTRHVEKEDLRSFSVWLKRMNLLLLLQYMTRACK